MPEFVLVKSKDTGDQFVCAEHSVTDAVEVLAGPAPSIDALPHAGKPKVTVEQAAANKPRKATPATTASDDTGTTTKEQ